jgi:predicted acetyltransferase
MRLITPSTEHLPAYIAALQRGWSADNMRPAAAAQEALAGIATDPAAFLRAMDDPDALGSPITLPDGTQRTRIPGLQRWMWDDEGFAGSINLRWMKAGAPLPPHVLGHVGYAVVPWRRQRGYATRALALLLPLARAQGLASVEITTDADNVASRRVITANGGVLVETFNKGATYGNVPGLRYRIDLAA